MLLNDAARRSIIFFQNFHDKLNYPREFVSICYCVNQFFFQTRYLVISFLKRDSHVLRYFRASAIIVMTVLKMPETRSNLTNEHTDSLDVQENTYIHTYVMQ